MPFCILSLLLFVIVINIVIIIYYHYYYYYFVFYLPLVKIHVNDKTNCKSHSLQRRLFTHNYKQSF